MEQEIPQFNQPVNQSPESPTNPPVTPESTQTQVPSPAPETQSPEGTNYTPYPEVPDPRKKALVIFGAILIVVLIILGGWYFFSKRNSNQQQTQTETKPQLTAEQEISNTASDLDKTLVDIDKDFKDLDDIDSANDSIPSF